MTETRLRAAAAGLALAGLGIAAYLTYTRYSGAQIACTTGGCETVQQSRYAVIAGVPVAVLGLIGYAAMLAAALVPRPNAAAIGLVLAVGGVAFSVYLFVAQAALIHAYCQWCLASEVVMLLLAIVSWARYAVTQRPTGMPQRGTRDVRSELPRQHGWPS